MPVLGTSTPACCIPCFNWVVSFSIWLGLKLLSLEMRPKRSELPVGERKGNAETEPTAARAETRKVTFMVMVDVNECG